MQKKSSVNFHLTQKCTFLPQAPQSENVESLTKGVNKKRKSPFEVIIAMWFGF